MTILALDFGMHVAGLDWYFDGSDGCSRCQNRTGFYDNYPGRPHQSCDCEISPVNIFSSSDSNYEYRNQTEALETWEEYEDLVASVNNATDAKFTKTIAGSKTYTVSASANLTLIQTVFGISVTVNSTVTESFSDTVEVPPDAAIELYFIPVYRQRTYEWDQYIDGEFEGHYVEIVQDIEVVRNELREM